MSRISNTGSGSGDGVWGVIAGTLSNQTDLQNALDAKENTTTKGNLTAGSNKVTIGGNGTDAVNGAGVSVDVAESNITHQNISGAGTNTHTNIDTHIGSSSNPHSVTASQVGLGSVDNVQQIPLSYLDTDGALAANSNTKVASQAATKTYADQLIASANALVYKGVIDCSSNPNYPAADAGHLYVVSVAGKIGGVSGTTVDVGDMCICNTDSTASGDQATVGSKWNIIEKNIVGAVTGPASSTDNHVAFFDSTSGKIIKDSGLNLSGSNTGDQTLPVKATSAELIAGVNDTKFATALGLIYFLNNSLYRQAIINGNFDVWQRGTTFTDATNAATGLIADRWSGIRGSFAANGTYSRQLAALNGSYYCLRAARDSGDSDTNALLLYHSLETLDSIKFIGQKVTISFYARKGANYSATSDILKVYIKSGTGTDENLVTGFTGSADVINSDVTLTSSWQKFTITSAAAIADSVTQLGVLLWATPTGTADANDYFEITQVQVNAGDIALPFMPKSFEQELLSCQRFYQKSFQYATAPAQNVASLLGAAHILKITNSESQYGLIRIHLPTRMRGIPTVTTYNPKATNANWRDENNAADRTVNAVGSVSETGFSLSSDTFASSNSNNYIHWTANAEF